MAIEKTLNTRILMKVDTLENWNSSTLPLKKGELAFATVAASAGTGLTDPVVMVKIGEDGVKTFKDLGWNFYAKASDVIAAAKSEDTLKTFITTVIADSGIASSEAMQNLADRTTDIETAIGVLNGDAATAGSVAKSIADALAALEIADIDGLSDSIAAAKKSGDDAMEEAQKKVASITAADASITVAGTATAPTVAVKLSADADNVLELAADGLKAVAPAAAEYSIVKAADSGDYAAVYNLTKDGTIVGASINIPKDLVVNSGSVVGDEIVLVLNDEANTEIKIPVASLIEYVTSGSAAGDMVVVNVSDDHKVTATITDGTITLAKLTTEVQTAIGKAHTHENADVLAGITADKVTAWDAKIDDVTAAADSGLKATKTGNTVAIEIDESVTFIFDCGTSAV
jgi:hypothetical protein